MKNAKIKPLFSEDEIQERVKTLGKELTEKFSGKDVLVIGILKGSFMFFSDLIREMDFDFECDFIGLSSYAGTKSSGYVHMSSPLTLSVKDKHIIVVEDMIETGHTLVFMEKFLSAYNIASLTKVVLIRKKVEAPPECDIDYIGIESEDGFLVGYGLDYDGLYRNLPYIAEVENLS